MANTFLRLALVSVPAAGMVIYLGVSGGRATEVARQPIQPPAVAASAEPTSSEPPKRAAGLSHDDAAAANRLLVGLSASRATWLTATVDGTQVIDRLLQVGEHQTFDVRNEIVLMTRDAAAITMTLNGADAKPLGMAGEVVTARLSPTIFKITWWRRDWPHSTPRFL